MINAYKNHCALLSTAIKHCRLNPGVPENVLERRGGAIDVDYINKLEAIDARLRDELIRHKYEPEADPVTTTPRSCNKCSQHILFRQLPDDKWYPINPDGSDHRCVEGVS